MQVMTPGQRNCHELIGHLLDGWDLDNVLFALDAHLGEMTTRNTRLNAPLLTFRANIHEMRASLRIARGPVEETHPA